MGTLRARSGGGARIPSWAPVCLTVLLFAATATAAPIASSTAVALVADAAMHDDLERVSALLEAGGDPSAGHGDGMTALHWAARNGNAEMATALIAAGAELGAKTRLGDYTPLHVAAKSGAASVVKTLVEAGGRLDLTTTTGVTPLHLAAASGSAEAVAILLEHGARVDAKEPTWGQTPLMFAAAKGRSEVVDVLLERGADTAVAAKVVDVTARNEADRAERRARNMRVAELRATERPDVVEPDKEKNLKDEKSAEERQKEREEAERRGGEPVPLNYADLVGTHGGLTPLLLAAREGHWDTALALIQGGADVNQLSAADRTSPMLMAMINGHFDLAMKFFELGADPELASEAGATPLYAALNMHWAPKSRHPQPVAYMQQKLTYMAVMETLLKAGVDPNVRLKKTLWYTTYNRDLLGVDRTGATPFWRAAYSLDIDAMRLLLSYGADPNLPTIKVPERRDPDVGESDDTDRSGLPEIPMGGPAVYVVHAASGVGHGQGFAGNSHRHVPDGWVPAVKFLVEELGADVNQRDHKGYTPLHHAAARGDNALIRYLVSKGADATAIARNGQTTADMANGPVQRVQPYPETVALLMSLGSKNNNKCVSC